MKYLILTPPLSVQDAEGLGKALARFGVNVGGIEVWHVYADGSRHRDDPTAKTIKETAGSFVSGTALSPISVPLFGLLPWFPPLWAILAGLVASIKSLHSLNRKIVNARAVSSEVHVGFDNPRQVRWFEYLVGAYCAKRGWQLRDPSHSARTGAAHGGAMPRAWADGQRKSSRVATWLKEH